MKTNRKTRPQPSLASLTADEYHQLADMVCTRTYEDVRQQINKPRSEGGFDLNISIKPLQVLHARVQRLHKINDRLATGEKLTLTTYDEIHAGDSGPCGEHRAPEEVHDAIMSATYALVTEHDNTPHQLLALQRLADFPARAEIREQSAAIRAEHMQIARAKEQRAEAKAQREVEMHTHKIQLDLRKLDLKIEMAEFQKQITTQRLTLQREKLAHSRLNPTLNLNPNPLTTESDDQNHTSQSARFTKDNSTRPKIRILVDEDGEPFTRFPTPNPLPDDVVIKNRAYTKKLLAGLIDPDTWEELDAPTPASLAFARGEIQDEPSLRATPAASSNGGTSSTSPTSTPRNEINNTNAQVGPVRCATRTSSDQFTLPSGPSSRDDIDPSHAQVGPVSPSGPLSRDEIHPTDAAPADPNATDIEESQTQNSRLKTQNWASLADAAPADPNATDIQNSSAPADPKSDHDSRSERLSLGTTLVAGLGSHISNQKSEIDVTPAPETQNSEQQIQTSSSSVPSPSVPSVLLSPSELAAELAAAVDRYTVNRAREHVAYEQKITAWPHAYSPPEYITQFRHCPCGHPSPCPVHESEEFGPFLERFWKVSPFNFLYRDSLRDRNLPYREPTEFSA